jgi:hypothetical protein
MLQHIGFFVVSNGTFQDFRYPFMRLESGAGHAIKTPGCGTVPVLLKQAKKDGAKLLLNHDLDMATLTDVMKVWGK